ncbi:aldehyde oxidase GLOX-like isoform X2 [Phalaenopsis equestris]|uniref:aldehyde oxidase GLOX-like isoform X2 n=1 Tax=Phalaenopsis equestris TaxID=78828 RepID=UPI0009E37B0D|nr:aldehyde oxidase GLOX-like isoform X2 [Phalaenopsis equestris]
MNPSTLLLIFLSLSHNLAAAAAAASHLAGGQWNIIEPSIGVSAMHMQLLHNDRVIIFDRTDFGRSNLSLPAGGCRDDPNDIALKHDCTAHSVEYDVAGNSFRPLKVLTDPWCSSGTVAEDGRLIQTGGFNDGDRTVRVFQPCGDGGCDWVEKPAELAVRRWYATSQILPDGRAIIVGGRRQYNYEFYPKYSTSPSFFSLPFLLQTSDPEENNLYPFLHLNVDGNLFIFSNNRAILLDYKSNKILRSYPSIPGSHPRNYPSSASSVLLPLNPSATEAQVLICGGAPKGSYVQASRNGTFLKALSTCGRIKITDPSPAWEMEEMPAARVMGDMILLPTGFDVLIINGAGAGTAGWELGREPVLGPIIYRPEMPAGSRFVVQSESVVPRLYHSSALLLRDGRVLVGGSNPHVRYEFAGVQYPTELSLEAFSPEYLLPAASKYRPEIEWDGREGFEVRYGEEFGVRFRVGELKGMGGVRVTMVAPAFATHSFSMNQRLIVLKSGAAMKGEGYYEVRVEAPATGKVAPPGFYMVFVVNEWVPSEGVWVHLGS